MKEGTHTKAKSTVSINNVPVRLIIAQLLLFIVCLCIPFLVTIWRGLHFKNHGIEAVAIANTISVFRSRTFGKADFLHSTQSYEFNDTYHSFSTGASGYSKLPPGSAVPIIYLPHNRNSVVLGTKADTPFELGHMSTFFEWNARILLGLLLYLFTAYGAYFYTVRTPERFPKIDFLIRGPAVSLHILNRINFVLILLLFFISSVVYFIGLAVNKHQPQLLSKSYGEGSFSAYHRPDDSVTIVLDSHIWGIIRSDQFDIQQFPIGTVHWDHGLNGISIYCMVNRVGNRSSVSIYTHKRTWYALQDNVMDSCFYYFDNKMFPSCKFAENQSEIIISAGDTTCMYQFNTDSLLKKLKPEKELSKANVFESPIIRQQYPEDSIIKSIRNLMGQIDSMRGTYLKSIDSGQ